MVDGLLQHGESTTTLVLAAHPEPQCADTLTEASGSAVTGAISMANTLLLPEYRALSSRLTLLAVL